MKVKCNKCGYIGDESEFPKGRDFFQFTFISGCPKKCGNSQSPDSASMRMMPSDEKRPRLQSEIYERGNRGQNKD